MNEFIVMATGFLVLAVAGALGTPEPPATSVHAHLSRAALHVTH